MSERGDDIRTNTDVKSAAEILKQHQPSEDAEPLPLPTLPDSKDSPVCNGSKAHDVIDKPSSDET